MVRVTKRKHHITLTTVTFLRFVMFKFWNYYVLKLLRLETITFSDATLSDINVVLCFVLSQYQAGRSWEYINHSRTHKCGNWDNGCTISLLGIFVSNFRYWFFAVHSIRTWGKNSFICCQVISFPPVAIICPVSVL
jgi:hypothetical protein